MDLIKSKKRFLFNIFAFYALLSYGYYFFFYIFQNYTNKIGFPLDVNYLKLVEGLIIVFFLALFYVYNDMNESVYLTYTFIFYVFIIVPSASYYFLTNNSRPFFYMQILSIVILNLFYIINKVLLSRNDNMNQNIVVRGLVKRKTNIAMSIFLGILGVFILADLIIFIKYGHSILYLFKLDKVYSIRLAARQSVPKKLSYVISWSAMVIVPSTVAWCIKIKKYYLIAIPAIIQILIFTIGGTKSHIFTLILVVFIFILYSYKKMELFLPFLNILIAATLLLKNAFVMAVVIRRAFFFPMSISYSYYDFFTKYPKLQLGASMLKHFYHNQYKIDIPFIISRYMYKTPVMSANSNYISNAYANFGLLGIIIFSVILAIILIMIERICFNEKNKRYIILITFCSFFALVNSALFTTMFTHGLIFALILAFIFFTAEKVAHKKKYY